VPTSGGGSTLFLEGGSSGGGKKRGEKGRVWCSWGRGRMQNNKNRHPESKKKNAANKTQKREKITKKSGSKGSQWGGGQSLLEKG